MDGVSWDVCVRVGDGLGVGVRGNRSGDGSGERVVVWMVIV